MAKTPSVEEEGDPGANLIDGYAPFIADVPITSHAPPFPVSPDDDMSSSEIAEKKSSLQWTLNKSKFSPPLPASDFCFVAQERWETETEPCAWCCEIL